MTYLDLASQDKLKIFLAFKGAFEFYSKALCFAAIKIQIPKKKTKTVVGSDDSFKQHIH